MTAAAPAGTHILIISTLGPATSTERDLRLLKENGVDFVRLNMSHSSIDNLKRAIPLARKVGIPFIIDTEGSQVRTGILADRSVAFEAGDDVRLYGKPVGGTRRAISLTPRFVVGKLCPGDILYCDFDSLAFAITDISTLKAKGFVRARVISGGTLGSNKSVYVDPASGISIDLPTLTPKDLACIAIGLREGVEHVAASFVRSGAAVREVATASRRKMKVISKVECIDGLKNLDDIIDESDYLLIDRGDLSKEISMTRLPLTQKIIVHRARRKKVPVIVATNFLESMIVNRRPTRAELHDIESSVTDGAAGLTLAAETAIGEHPIECVSVMRNTISHITSSIDVDKYADKEHGLVSYLEEQNYLLDFDKRSPLIPPHGGTLIDRTLKEKPDASALRKLVLIDLPEELQMDVEQIGIGAYSPLEGFMGKKELRSVLSSMRLPSGRVWPLPILLDVNEETAGRITVGDTVVLCGDGGRRVALLHVSEKYRYDTERMMTSLFGTTATAHPGVRRLASQKPVFLAGKIDLIARRQADTAGYELTPRQTRRFFEDRGWRKIVGFHTRNPIHRSHEFIQIEALERTFADGLFVQPVVGKKKKGDFTHPYIIESYNIMLRQFYPKNKVLFGAFATYSRYAGPREALFTAIVRQNFGCSHFIVGRDHTGVGDFYAPTASHEIFERFPDLLIKPVRFGHVFYSRKLRSRVHEHEDAHQHKGHERLSISGTETRKMLEAGKLPPSWFMRKEVATMLRDAVKSGKRVFIT